MTTWLDPDEELGILDYAAQQDALLTAYQQNPHTPQLAQHVGGLAALYPWLTPGVALSMGKAGYTPNSPEARGIAEVAHEEKRKRGFGWHSIGNAISGAAHAVKDAGDWAVPDQAGDVARGASRVAFTGLSLPYEIGQAKVRNAYSAVTEGDVLGFFQATSRNPGYETISKEAVQTTLGSAVQELTVEGETPDLGSGYFPGGSVRQRQIKNARAAALIDGHAVTPGRLVAHYSMLEPGGQPYNIVSGLTDAGVALRLDPAAAVLSATGQLRKLDRTFQRIRPIPAKQTDLTDVERLELGQVDGIRRTILTENVDNWLTSEKGRGVREFLTNETDADAIWNATGRKLPVRLAANLADATTDADVLRLLRADLGIGVRLKPRVGGFGVRVRNVTYSKRLWQNMPGQHVPLRDPDELVEQMDRWQRNARLDRKTIAENNGRLMRASTRQETFDAVTAIARPVRQALRRAGMDETAAHRVTTLWKNSTEDARSAFIDDVGRNVDLPWVKIGPDNEPLASPHLWSEFLNSSVTLSDARDIRRVTSRYSKVVTHEAWKTSVAATDFVTQQIFKPFVLLRGAWTIRVIAEEQLRLAAAGLTSMFAHPGSHIAALMGKKGALGVTGDVLAETPEGIAALSKGSAGFRDIKRGTYAGRARFNRDTAEYIPAWGDEIVTLANDPVAREVARDSAAAKDMFWSGNLQRYRKELASATEPELRRLGDSREAADAYIDTVTRRIKIKTGDHADLVEAVAHGRFRGADIVSKRGDRPVVSKEFRDGLRGLRDEGVGPAKVVGDRYVHGKADMGRWDKFVETMFNTLMSRPTNFLSRSPAFRTFYWQRVADLAGDLDPAQAERLIVNARKANVDKDVLLRLEGARQGSGRLALEDMDLLAKGHGLDETRRLLYDLHRRSQFADVTRTIFPFAEAWKEVLTTWARLGTENPAVVRRFQQTIEGARGAGFFYTDENGEERFAYPGSEWVTKQLTGVPVKLDAPVQGLNLVATSVLPGFGPVVTMTADKLLPDTPEWDWVREKVMPFGAPDTQGGVVESLLPAWVQKFRTAGWIPGVGPTPEQQRLYANSVMEVQAALLTTGDYDVNTEAGQRKLVRDAKSKAKYLFLIRGSLQWGAPAAPSFEFMAQDPKGQWVSAQGVREAFRDIETEVGYEQAPLVFLHRYGTDALLYMQGKSKAVIPGVEPTDEAYDWARKHKDIRTDHPLVYGWFAPTGGEFSHQAYAAQFERGEREPLTPAQAVALANSRLASLLYRTARTNVEQDGTVTDTDRAWLNTIRGALEQEFPGYGAYTGLTERPDTDTLIASLQKAAQDPRLANTDQGQALRVYFTARDKALTQAKDAGYTTLGAKALAPTRAWLATIAKAITHEVPQFQTVWERLLSREVD